MDWTSCQANHDCEMSHNITAPITHANNMMTSRAGARYQRYRLLRLIAKAPLWADGCPARSNRSRKLETRLFNAIAYTTPAIADNAALVCGPTMVPPPYCLIRSQSNPFTGTPNPFSNCCCKPGPIASSATRTVWLMVRSGGGATVAPG